MKRPVAAALLFALLLAAVWWVPSWCLTRAVNGRLRSIPGYDGGVGGVRLSWWPLALVVTDLRIEKREETAPAAFVTVPSARVDVGLGSLLGGRVRLRIRLDRPDARFLMRQRKPDQKRKFALWQPFFARLPAFRISDLTVMDGTLRIRNDEDIPPLDLAFDRINGAATNLANRPGLTRGFPRLGGRARMLGHAPLTLFVETKPFQERVDFRLTGTLTSFRLATLNPTLRHYTGVDIQSGTLDVEGDITAAQGVFQGRIRRSLRDVQVIKGGERHSGVIPLLKEVFFQTWLNNRKDVQGDLSASYLLTGPLGYMNADVFLANVWTAKSAFLQSLRPTLPPTVLMGTPQKAEEEWLDLQARERLKRSVRP